MQIINKTQETVLKIFSNIPDSRQFYLTGGTALSYFYLKHRRSNDLDFFTAEENIVLPFSYQIESYLKKQGYECLRQRGLHSFVELIVTVNKESTLIHLAVDSAYRFDVTKEFPDYPGLRVDNLTDIAANKMLALFGRAALRDFIDVYSLIDHGNFTKDQLIGGASQKDPGFDIYWLAVAFERIAVFDSRSADILMLLNPLSFETLKTFFDQWRREITEKLKP